MQEIENEYVHATSPQTSADNLSNTGAEGKNASFCGGFEEVKAHLDANEGASSTALRGTGAANASEIGQIGTSVLQPRLQTDALLDWAYRNNKIFSPETECREYIGAGAEHVVYAHPEEASVLKVADLYRAMKPEIEITADSKTPFIVKRGKGNVSDYLERASLQNQVFGDDLKIRGVTPQGEIVTSQPFHEKSESGAAPTLSEIMREMEDHGFRAIGKNPENGWWRSDGVMAIDTHAGNFVRTRRGIVPIDVPLSRMSPEELLEMKKEYDP